MVVIAPGAAHSQARPSSRRQQFVAAWALSFGTVVTGAGCGDGALEVSPIIEAPLPGTDADPFPDLDSVVFELAISGEQTPLSSEVFARGEPILLSGAPLEGDLVLRLIGRIDNADVAYGRTCAFSLENSETPPSPRLYFSRTVKWAQGPLPAEPTRYGGTGVVAADGSVIFVGGTRGSDLSVDEPAREVDRFDPESGTITAVASVAPRNRTVTAALGDHHAVVVGGTETSGNSLTSFLELIDPLASEGRRVERLDDPRLARLDSALTTLSDGSAILTGGRTLAADGVSVVTTGSTLLIAPLGSGAELRTVRGALAIPRSGHTATRLSDDLGAPVLVVGGLDEAGLPVATAELYKPLQEDYADAATFQPQMITPRSGHRAIRLPDGSVLIVGGLDGGGQPVRELEIFSLDAGFAAAGMLPTTAGALDVNLSTLPDGRVLLSGGRAAESSPPVATAFVIQLDPLDNAVDVVATDAMDTPRAGHAAAMLCDGTIVIVGGSEGASPTERYAPPAVGRR